VTITSNLRVTRHATRLSDGRELIYFDERDDLVRTAVDRRELPARAAGAELRYDPLTDEWVAVAAHRQLRTLLPPASECPLCPSSPTRATEIPADQYDVVVFENRFPSFGAAPMAFEAPAPPTRWNPVRAGGGRCEVIAYTSDHDSSLSALSPQRVRTLMVALADRTQALSAMPEVQQVFCFENRGTDIGVTLHHPHGQIYAYPFLPPRTRATLSAARRHADLHGSNLFADILAAERAASIRVVAENASWTAFVPAAARWPFEIFLAPQRIVADLPGLTDTELDDFGPIYLDILRRLDGVFGVPMPYVSAWHQAPVRTGRDVSHLYLQLFSIRRGVNKLKYLAGSESAMGAFVNDIAPEEAAAMLRAL
jgi:UDPglucose--hexose-1-phosphate uridylyltransferase